MTTTARVFMALVIIAGGLQVKAWHAIAGFEANAGQWDQSVRWVARGPQFVLLIDEGGATVALPQQRIRIEVVGARRDAAVEGDGLSPAAVHYLTGNERTTRRNVRVWESVRQRDTLPGIDLVYHAREGNLETDFVVRPGADVGAIRLRFTGTSPLCIDGDGTLHAADLLLPRPVAYQGEQHVDVAYRIEDGEVAFDVGAYDPARELIIDPLLYSTYIGGGSRDEANAIAVDAAGNAYIAGYTYSPDIPGGTSTLHGEYDAFVVKLAAGGTIAYRTYLGGTYVDYATAIAVDDAGRAYVTGWTGSRDFPVADAAQAAFGGGNYHRPFYDGDAFVTKLSADGSSILYSTYLGGEKGDYATSIAVDNAGLARIGGQTPGAFPTTAGALQSTSPPPMVSGDGFIAIIDTNRVGSASLIYSTYLGGTRDDSIQAVAIDAAGSIYVAGTTGSRDFPILNALQETPGGQEDLFIAKLAPDGARLIYSTLYGGSGRDLALGLAVDSGFRAHVIGTTNGSFPAVNARQPAYGGGTADVVIVKLDAAGRLLYATHHGGGGEDRAGGIAVTAAGEVVISGSTTSTDLPVALPIQPAFGGRGSCTYRPGIWKPCRDAFVSSLDVTGRLLRFSTYAGGGRDDVATAVAVDAAGVAYVAGYSNSPGSDPFPLVNAVRFAPTEYDAFVAAISGGPVPPPPNLIADALEVTQAVQDLDNSVRLVANKRSFVRFHVHSSSAAWATTARLGVTNGSRHQDLTPINPGGYIVVRPTPDRAVVDHAFLFELPTWATTGTTTLSAEINPVIGTLRGRNPLEPTYADNALSATAVFQAGAEFDLNTVMYQYRMAGAVHTPPSGDVDKLESWLRRTFPMSRLNASRGIYDWPFDSIGPPACGIVDAQLFTMWIVDHIVPVLPLGIRYYGMVSDGGAFMRGCSFPGPVASGPAGPATGGFGWDTDGRYADWYGAHELGHAYGRWHLDSGRGEEWPVNTVNPGGAISAATIGAAALFGFDAETRSVVPPTAGDVMSYAPNQWIGKFTYHGLHPPQIGLRSYRPVQPQLASLQLPGGLSVVEPRFEPKPSFVVTGVIETGTNRVQLLPVTGVSRAPDVAPVEDSKHVIVLKGSSGQTLARVPFHPKELAYGPVPPGVADLKPHSAVIAEIVPRTDEATEIAVEIEGRIAGKIRAGARPPAVTIESPRAGQRFSGATIPVKWKGTDADGDRLTYHVLYSADRAAWSTVRAFTTERSIALDTSFLAGSDRAYIRILVTDGIHTTQRDTGPFSVSHKPPSVRITSPATGATIVAGQTVRFEALALTGGKSVSFEALSWTSDQLGLLGRGSAFSASMLPVGTHLITLSAQIPRARAASASVTVTVVDPSAAAVPNELIASPALIVLGGGTGAASISFDNRNGIPKDPDIAIPTALVWKLAGPVPPWLSLSRSQGMTPDSVTVAFSGHPLPPTDEVALLRFVNARNPQNVCIVRVQNAALTDDD